MATVIKVDLDSTNIDKSQMWPWSMSRRDDIQGDVEYINH